MSMPAVLDDDIGAYAPAVASALSARVWTDLEAAEPVWRALEARGGLSPYQRFDWIKAYRDAGFEDKGQYAVVVLETGGEAIALLPLVVKSRFSVRIVQIIGMPISNMDSLVFDPAHRERLTPNALHTMFAALSEAGIAVDLMSFHCVLPDPMSGKNPLLAFPHAPAPNRLYYEPLEPFNPKGEYALPKHRRKNIRYSRRKLEAEFGPLRLERAATREDIERFEDIFLAQRTRRFAEMGVENIFARPAFRSFFTDLAEKERNRTHPALAFHALCAGDMVLAISIGAYAGGHYSHYMNSTTDGPAARYSIIGVLLTMLLDDLRQGGITSFDIGLGDFDYKTDWTDAHEVYDVLVPLTFKGRASVPLLGTIRKLKRVIKQTPALWSLARKAQSAALRLKR